jgi:hypothetical protein
MRSPTKAFLLPPLGKEVKVICAKTALEQHVMLKNRRNFLIARILEAKSKLIWSCNIVFLIGETWIKGKAETWDKWLKVIS